MKKRILSALLTAVLACSLLAGCGSSSSSSDSSSDDTATESSEGATVSEDGSSTTTSYGTYTADDPYHVVFAYIEFYEQDDDARSQVEDELNEYLRENYHLEVEFLPLAYAEYQQTVQLMFSGGDELDVMAIYFSTASSWISMNGIVDMSPYMDTEDGQAIVEALGEENAYVGTMNGVLYGFPANKESVELGGLCMRADICDELGLTEKYNLVDKEDGVYTGEYYDWSVAAEIFAEVQAAYPSMTPLYLQGSSSQMNRFAFFDTLADNFGVLDWEADHESTTVVNEYETETYLDVVTMLAEWYDAGYIYQDALTDTQGSTVMMKAGNTFSYATAIKPGFLSEAESSIGMDLYVMYFGNSVEGGISTTNVSFYNTGIATNSEDPEMAFKFISALYSDPVVMTYWQYGIEDVHYQTYDDGTVYYVDGEDGSNYTYHQNTGWLLGNQFNIPVWNDGTKDADYWTQLQDHNTWADYSPAFGFMWDSSAYSTQITALQNALDTYRPALETGSVGVSGVESTLQSLNDALYAAGLQDVMDAKQEQLDEWLAENGATENPAENDERINSVS